MALNTLIVGVITCVLIGSAIAFAELHAWRGLRCYALYAGAGLIASELVAAPAMWELFALPAGWLESVAMTIALAVGLWRVCKFISRGTNVTT